MTDQERKLIMEMIEAAFGGPRIVCAQPKERDWQVFIEPALGAGARKRTVRASSQEEATVKAKQIAREMCDAECVVQFME